MNETGAGPLAGLVAGFDAEAARMRATMGDRNGRDWLAMGAADFDTDTERAEVQGSLFGAELAGPGELAGQGSLFAEGITP